MTDDDRIARVAALVRAAYCLERNQWHLRVEDRVTDWGAGPLPRYDGGRDGSGRWHQGAWEGVARFALARGFDPLQLVAAQFRGHCHRPPEPSQLTSAAAVAAYRRAAAEGPARLGRALDTQKSQAAAELDKLAPAAARYRWSAADAARAVLTNSLVGLSPLFRHCLAARHGLADVAEMFAEPAVLQYLPQAADYDRVWGDWIPAPLRALARRLTEAASVPAPRTQALSRPDAPPPFGGDQPAGRMPVVD